MDVRYYYLRIPDVSFIVSDRVPEEGNPEGFWKGAPTLSVEVVSPNDRADDIHHRVQDYLQAGSKQVWVLWPRQRSVSVYRPNADTREVGPDGPLDGADILSGFSIRLGDVVEIRRIKKRSQRDTLTSPNRYDRGPLEDAMPAAIHDALTR